MSDRQSKYVGTEKVYMDCPMCGMKLYEMNGQPGSRYEVAGDAPHKCPHAGAQGSPGKTKVAEIG